LGVAALDLGLLLVVVDDDFVLFVYRHDLWRC
jgi:hypothetical protein